MLFPLVDMNLAKDASLGDRISLIKALRLLQVFGINDHEAYDCNAVPAARKQWSRLYGFTSVDPKYGR